MDNFINRRSELRLIEDAFDDLLNKDTILRTPLINFYGVEGIGKTSILKKVLQTCDKNHIRYIWADASKNTPDFFHEIIKQAQQYGEISPSHIEGNLRDQSVAVTRGLLGKGPLVMLLDAIDATNETLLEPIEGMLSDLVMNNRLFVVLTSSRSVLFQREKDVARKLTIFPLLPLDQKSCEEYLDSIDLSAELREIIFAWTRGYPLAMNVMVNAIKEQGIDPRSEQGRQTLLEIITHRVIDQGILACIEQAEQPWFRTVITLLSVPRRFNLLIMQKLVERFAPELKLANSLAYASMSNRIIQSTDVLSWNPVKRGFSIDSSIRNIFLLQLAIEQLDYYHEINHFLAKINQTNAEDVSDPDYIRYQREYLYHLANSGDEAQLPHIFATTVQQIIQDTETTPERLIQFREEFIQDVELQELLGERSNIILSLINKELAQQMYRNTEQERDENKRVRYFHDFFSYTIQSSATNDLATTLTEHINHLIAQERPTIILKLYEELARDENFREALGKDFSVLLAHIRNNIPPEELMPILDEQITKHFIGHTKELDIFEQWLTYPDNPWILFLHDATDVPAKKGGVGKTWLLRKYARIAKEHDKNIAIAVIDFFSVADRYGVEVARRIVESLQEAHPDWSPDLFTGALAEYDGAIRAQKNLNEFRDKLHTALTSDLEILDKQLVGSKRQLIVFFDTYEVIERYPTIAALSSAYHFPDRYQFKRMGVVIAGRNAPDWEHVNWRGRSREEVLCVPISPFSQDEMVQFLNDNINVMGLIEVQSPEAQVLYASTEGRPILVGLVADMLNNRIMTLNELLAIPKDRFESYLVEQINNLANPINWVVLFMAHIYHRFNEKLLNWLFEHLLGIKDLVQDIPTSHELSKKLLQLSFVRLSGNGDNVALHDEMRRLVNKYNWKTQESQTGLYRRELSQSVISYYEHEIASEPNELILQTYMVEMLYHQLFVDVDEGFKAFEQHFWRAINLRQNSFARSLLQEMLQFRDYLSPKQNNRIMLGEARLLSREENSIGALALYRKLEQQADENWLKDYSAEIWFEKGNCYQQMSQLPEAIICLTKALEIATAQQRETRAALVLGTLGRCYHREGDLNKAADCYERSIAIHKKLGNQRGYADVMNIMSDLYRLQGKTDEALRRCKIALNIRRGLYEQGKASEFAVGLSLQNMGAIYLSIDNLINAQKFFQEAYEIYERNEYRKGLAMIYNRFGQIAIAKNELTEAMQWFEKAYNTALGIDAEAAIKSLNKQGWVLVQQGRLEEAIPLLKKAIEHAQQVNDYYQRAESLIDLADVLERLNRHQESYGMLQEAEAISRERNFNYLLGIAKDFRGENKYNEGDYTTAFKHFGEYCYYMALYNPIQYSKAVRKTTILLLDTPKQLIPQLIETLSTDWLSHQLDEKDSLMLNALEEIRTLIDA